MAQTDRLVARHRFSPEIRRAIRACSVLDNWHGPLEIFEHWMIVAVAIFASLQAWEHLPLIAAVPIFGIAVYVIGGRQRALAGVLHQACHGTLMANRRLGRTLGALLGGYPVFQSFSGYMASHVRNHHNHFGDPERDPDYRFLVDAGLYGMDIGRPSLRRYLIGIFGPRSTLQYVLFLLRHRILTKGEGGDEAVFRIVVYGLVLAFAAWWGILWAVAAYWLLPMVTTQAWIGSLAELFEHYRLMETESRTDLHMAHNREFGPVWDAVLGEKRGEGYHLVHHLFPSVPIWRLHEVHEVLLEDPEYARQTLARNPLEALRVVEASLPD